MSKKNEILKQVGSYALGAQTAQLITLVAAVLSRKFLGPMQMGIWSTLQIIVDYSKYATFGVVTAMSREIPYKLGQKNQYGAEEVKNLTFSFILASSVLLAVVLLLFAALTYGVVRPEITYGLIFVATIIFLQRMNNLYIALIRSYKEFKLAGRQMIASAIVNAVFVALLAYHFRIYGFMIALVFSFIFNIAFVHFYQPYKFHWQLNREKLKPLMKLGFPLMMVGIIMTVLRSLDKIIIARFLGFEALGQYSIAIMICSFASNFSTSVGVVLFPHFQEKIASRDRPEDLKEYLFQSTLAYSCCMPVLIGVAWFAAPYFVGLLLPQYVDGVPAMQALSLSLFCIALIEPCHHFLIAIRKHLWLFPLLGASAGFALVLTAVCVRAGYGIVGIAASMSLTFLCYFSGVFFLCGKSLANWHEVFLRYVTTMVPGIYMIAVILGIRASLGTEGYRLGQAMTHTGVFLIFCVPFAIFLNRRFAVLSVLKSRYFTSH